MSKEKLKVAWICHFSNEQIRAKLPLLKKKNYLDFAPWISNLITEFEKRDELELHIISPHKGLTRLRFSFTNNGISYHFFKSDIPIIHKNWPNSYFPLDYYTGFIKNKILIGSFIRKIKPSIINLHGAENSYYSSYVLSVKKIPVYVCIQGIYSNPDRFDERQKPFIPRIKVERKIHKKLTYFGIFPKLFADLIKRDNPNPILLINKYIPKSYINDYSGIEKKYDFVYFGRITDIKGIDKIIEAINHIRKTTGRLVSFIIIGIPELGTKQYLEALIAKHQLEKNIHFLGKFKKIEDVHKKAMEARVTVMSPKFENLSGTIQESALLGIPVAATAVGGIPFLNKEGKTILLSEYGDIPGLAKNMLTLLDNPDYANTLAQKCKEFILHEFSADIITTRYIKQYHAIIKHFNNGDKISDDLLFNEEHFIYEKH